MKEELEWKSLNPENRKFTLDTNKDAHGWIQFKGGSLCMDVHCTCGHHSHIDGNFIYFLRCPACGSIYELNGHIQLIERPDLILNEDINIHDPQN